MKFNKVIAVLISLQIGFSANFSPVYAVDSVSTDNFIDIQLNHWAIPAINWGLSRGMLGGYEDGTLRPDRTLSEGEFTTIFARYASNTNRDLFDDLIYGGHWSQNYYKSVVDFALPLRGYTNDLIKDAEVSRGQIAQVVAAKYGFNLTEKQAVYFMYENKLSKGMIDGMTWESYGAEQSLTRAQAIQFMLTIDNQGATVMKFKGNPSVKGPAAQGQILGIAGVPLSTEIVNFADFGGGGGTVVTPPVGAPTDYLQKDGDFKGVLNEQASYFYDELAMKSVKLYVEGGKYYISVDLPQLPEGFTWKIGGAGYDSNSKYVFSFGGDSYTGLGAGKQVIEIKFDPGKTYSNINAATFAVEAQNAQGKSLMLHQLSSKAPNKILAQSTNLPGGIWKNFNTAGIFNWK